MVPENGAFRVRSFMVSSASASVIFAFSIENCNCLMSISLSPAKSSVLRAFATVKEACA